MELTEKGRVAFNYALQYCKDCIFSAADLSEKCGEKIAAATLSGIVNRGYLEKIDGKPVRYKFIDGIDELIANDTDPQGCDNSKLLKAKKEKNNEFYTRLDDISNEVKNYKKFFKGKKVFCNCNDSPNNNFFMYFLTQFDSLNLEKLVAISYDKTGHGVKYTVENDINGDGYIDEKDIITEELIGDGGFATEESIAELKESDIVCTNPPFSVFREYMSLLIKYNKQFLIIGNQNAITYKEIFPLIKENKIWLGYSTNKTMTFEVPESYNFVERNNKGVGIVKVPAISWFTNLPTNQRAEPMTLTATYYDSTNKREEYPKYDNYDAINVDKVVNIPKDYMGVMGVPITFLNKYCPEQFEIVAFRKDEDGAIKVFSTEEEREFNSAFISLSAEELLNSNIRFDYGCAVDTLYRWKEQVRQNCDKEKTAVDIIFPLATNLKNGMINNQTINGKKGYCRILIRRKSV